MNKVVIGLLVLLFVLKIAWISSTPMVSDEYVHYYLADYILDNGEPFLFQEEYLVPNWSVGQLPLFHYILAGLMTVFPIWAIRYILGIGVPLITTWFVYKLFYKYDSTGVMAVLFNFVPNYFVWSSVALYIEGMFVLFSVATIYFYVNSRKWWPVFYLLLMGLKYYIGAGIGLMLFYDSYRTKKWKKFIVFLLITAILIPVHYYVNRMTLSVIESGYSAKYGENQVLHFFSMIAGIYPNELFQYDIISTFIFLMITGVFVFLVMMPHIWKEHKFETIWFFTFACFMLFGTPDSRRMVLLAPLIFWSVWAALKDHKKAIKIVAFFILIAFIMNIYGVWRTFGYTDNFIEHMEYLNTLPDDVLIMSPYMYETSFFTGKPVVGLNLNLNTNNATHLVMITGWVKTGHWYRFLIPDVNTLEGNGWTRRFENKDVYVLEIDIYVLEKDVWSECQRVGCE